MENLVVNMSFWRGKRVFVTGHTGFKGGWLCLWLQRMGAEVTGFSLQPPTDPSMFEVAAISRSMCSVIGDVRDAESLKHVMTDARPEVLFHLAAQPLVRYSYVNPVETYATNVMGLVHLFEAVRSTPDLRSIVIVTSDKCYENKEWPWGYRENESMGGYDPYSNSKGCAELVTAAYRNSYFNPGKYAEHGVAVASARAGNVIGGGDWALDRLIPDMLRAVENGEPVLIRNPDAIRPWQHALEPLSGYLLLAEKLHEKGPEFGEGWNFGPHDVDAKPVKWLIERITSSWGEGASWRLDNVSPLHEATYLKLDSSKARSRLGWRSRWDIEKTLNSIIAWHKAYRDCADMQKMTLDQIDTYQNS